MAVLKKIKSLPDAVNYFKELPFYNKHMEQRKMKLLKNIDLLSELPIYEELNVIKTILAFRRCTISYKVEIVGEKNTIKQLEVSKPSIKDLFSDVLNEKKGCKY